MQQKKQKFFDPDDIATHVSLEIRKALEATCVTPRDPATELLCKELSSRFLKKYVPETQDTEVLELNAFLLFEEVNKRMAWANSYVFPNPDYFLKKGVPQEFRVLLLARRLISQVLGEFSEDEFFASCKNSSGTTLGISYRDTSPEAKFKVLTHSPGVDKWFRYYLQYDSQLKAALPDLSGRFVEARFSKATTVPKDSSKVRMICVEPMLNMFFQQGLMQCLTSRLERVGLSFTSQQDRNKSKAWYGSLTGAYCTIDWSSASDSLSYELLRFLLPRKWFYYLDQFRSSSISYMGGVTKLHMFSTMGNACTFPLETLVFWALATSIQHDDSTSFLDPHSSTVMVFGDDCILDNQHAECFVTTLLKYGFQPNLDKSFWEGSFRESCGGDYLAGKDVRSYYLTGPSGKTINHLNAWLNIIVNRLFNRFIRIEGPLRYIYAFHGVFDYIFSLYRKYQLSIYIVPTDFPDDAGLKIGVDFFRFLKYFRIRDLCSEVTVDSHGTKRFNYLQSIYPSKKKTNQDIRYWMAIKGLSSEAPSHYSVKRRQSYVVAKGLSPVFTLNTTGRH